jgi:hypothetical protein
MPDPTCNVFELLLHLLPNNNKKEMARGILNPRMSFLISSKIRVTYFLYFWNCK